MCFIDLGGFVRSSECTHDDSVHMKTVIISSCMSFCVVLLLAGPGWTPVATKRTGHQSG